MPLIDHFDPEVLKTILAPDPPKEPLSKEGIAPPLSRDLPCSDLDTDSESGESEDYYASESPDSECGYISTASADEEESEEEKDKESRAQAPMEEPLVSVGVAAADWPMLGAAEYTRSRSRQTQAFCELKYPTGDDDAAEGFRLRGFYRGARVYHLESLISKQLRASVFKTAVGFCYLNISELFPPKVVEVGPSGVPVEKTPNEADETEDSRPAGDSSAGCDLISLASDGDDSPKDASAGNAVQVSQDAERPQSGESAHDGKSAASETAIPAPIMHTHVNGYFAIRPSALGGLGSFALQDIARGTHILVERPLVRTDLFHLSKALDRLRPQDRAAYFALAGHHPDPYVSPAERIWTANTFVAGSLEAVFTLASRFNHACAPRNNVGYHYDTKQGALVMTTIRRVAAGTELVISYGKTPQLLFERFGFRCACGACQGFTEEMAQHYANLKWR